MFFSPGDLEPDSLFHGRYRVIRRLGRGSMGSVYEVIDEATNGRRALKLMDPEIVRNSSLRERFTQEAKITGDIESDHLVRVTDAGIDSEQNLPFLVMELLRGDELGHLLRKRQTLLPEEVALYVSQLALALDKTHARGIIHRDIKPENLFLTHRDDGTPCIKILDFGIAKLLASHAAQAHGTRVGTPLYMAPEQMSGDRPGPYTDIHALGHLAYELLVGAPYWLEESDAAEALMDFYLLAQGGPKEPATQRARRHNPALALPPTFDVWFSVSTARDPAKRFPTASEQALALREILTAKTNGARAHTIVNEATPDPDTLRKQLEDEFPTIRLNPRDIPAAAPTPEDEISTVRKNDNRAPATHPSRGGDDEPTLRNQPKAPAAEPAIDDEQTTLRLHDANLKDTTLPDAPNPRPILTYSMPVVPAPIVPPNAQNPQGPPPLAPWPSEEVSVPKLPVTQWWPAALLALLAVLFGLWLALR